MLKEKERDLVNNSSPSRFLGCVVERPCIYFHREASPHTDIDRWGASLEAWLVGYALPSDERSLDSFGFQGNNLVERDLAKAVAASADADSATRRKPVDSNLICRVGCCHASGFAQFRPGIQRGQSMVPQSEIDFPVNAFSQGEI
jgi:hypothetical protein